MTIRGALSLLAPRALSLLAPLSLLSLAALAAVLAAPCVAASLQCEELRCRDGGRCVKYTDRCDGVRDCGDGSDEDATTCRRNMVSLPVGAKLTATVTFLAKQRWVEFIACNRRNCSHLDVIGVARDGQLSFVTTSQCNAFGRACPRELLQRNLQPGTEPLSEGAYEFVVHRRPGALAVWLAGYPQQQAVLALAEPPGDALRLQLQPGIWAASLDVAFSVPMCLAADPECEPAATTESPAAQGGALRVGARVVRGPDWAWGDQDGGAEGRVLQLRADGWVSVRWPNGDDNVYRMGVRGKHDLRVVVGGLPERPGEPGSSTPAAATESPESSDSGTASLSAAASGLRPGSVVARGRDWVWGAQDGGDGNAGAAEGHVLAVDSPLRGWVHVRWNRTGKDYNYRMGARGRFDLREVRRGGGNEQPDAEWIAGTRTTTQMDVNEVELLPERPRSTTAGGASPDDDVEWIPTTKAPGAGPVDGSVTSGVEAAFRIKPCSAVVRGADWKWGAQDGGQGGREGVALSAVLNNGWVEVRWPSGQRNTYRMGAEGKYDLRLVERDADQGGAAGAAQAQCVLAEAGGRNWQQ